MIESPKARAAFVDYCGMGPSRSLAKLAQHYGKNTAYVRQLERWSSQLQWVERTAEYDKERAAEKQSKQQQAIDAMNERQALIGTTQQARAIKRIEELITGDDFGASPAVQLLRLGVEIERVARGSSTQQIALTGKDGESLAGAFQVHVFMPEDNEEGDGE